MNRILFWACSLFVVGALFTSCKDDDVVGKDQIAEVRENKQKNETFMMNKRLESDVMSDPSGLLYSVTLSGTGEKPSAIDTVVVSYQGMTIDEKTFVSTSDTIALVDLEDGLQVGLRHMPVGSTYRLYVPYYLMYGSSGTEYVYGGKTISILPYSALVYDMTLNAVIKVDK